MAVPRSTLEQAHRLVHFASTAADEGPPMQVPAEINADDLIMFVRASGRTITRDQINRWQRKGLLPPSRQRGLGRGLGSETIFPIVAVPQTEALHDALKLGRNFDDVGWRLWWLGFPVEDRYWRTRASHWATEWDRVLKAVRLLTGDRPNRPWRRSRGGPRGADRRVPLRGLKTLRLCCVTYGKA